MGIGKLRLQLCVIKHLTVWLISRILSILPVWETMKKRLHRFSSLFQSNSSVLLSLSMLCVHVPKLLDTNLPPSLEWLCLDWESWLCLLLWSLPNIIISSSSSSSSSNSSRSSRSGGGSNSSSSSICQIAASHLSRELFCVLACWNKVFLAAVAKFLFIWGLLSIAGFK